MCKLRQPTPSTHGAAVMMFPFRECNTATTTRPCTRRVRRRVRTRTLALPCLFIQLHYLLTMSPHPLHSPAHHRACLLEGGAHTPHPRRTRSAVHSYTHLLTRTADRYVWYEARACVHVCMCIVCVCAFTTRKRGQYRFKRREGKHAGVQLTFFDMAAVSPEAIPRG